MRADVAKSVADSFLFFLFYEWFRARRLLTTTTKASYSGAMPGRRRYLSAAEELVVGAAAGACARLFTTPIANVVTRRQTASLMSNGDKPNASSLWDMLAQIKREKGIVGLWAGYSAALVLTLNPSITFFLQKMLEKSLVPGDDEDDISAAATFLLAAGSKAVATVATYPFQIAKARLQISTPDDRDRGSAADKTNKANADPVSAAADAVRRVLNDNIFTLVASIATREGVTALYQGLAGELLKAFFSHGITMVSKAFIDKLLIRLYFAFLALLRRRPDIRSQLVRFFAKTPLLLRSRAVGSGKTCV
jgi:hypothetical protein